MQLDLKKIIVAALLVAIIFTFFYKRKINNNLNTDLAKFTVSVVSPQEGVIATKIILDGTIAPKDDVLISTSLDNIKVKNIFVKPGDQIIKDQKLIELDSDYLMLKLQNTKSNYEISKDEYNRISKLADTNIASKELIHKKFKNMEISKANFDEAELNLKNTIIYAPVNGIIYEKNVKLGEVISAKQILLRISYENKLQFEAEIDESHFRYLNTGQQAEIYFSQNSTPFTGQIDYITPKIDPLSRSSKIRINFNNNDLYPIGTAAHAEIIANKQVGKMLPLTCLQSEKSSKFVWLVDQDNKVNRKYITLKATDKKNFISDDLELNAKYIAKAGSFLKEKDQISIYQDQ